MSISLVRVLRAFGLLRVIIAISLLHTSSSIRFHSVFSAMALTNSSSLSSLGQQYAHEADEMKLEPFLQISDINSFGSCQSVAHTPGGLITEGQVIILQRLRELQV
jgi:hypothetical protein